MAALICPPTGKWNHFLDLCDKQNEIWKNDLFTNVTFIIGETVFKAHQSVLAPLSPFLKSLFASRSYCNGQPDNDILIIMDERDFSKESFRFLLDFLYKGETEAISSDMYTDIQNTVKTLGINVSLGITLAPPIQISVVESVPSGSSTPAVPPVEETDVPMTEDSIHSEGETAMDLAPEEPSESSFLEETTLSQDFNSEFPSSPPEGIIPMVQIKVEPYSGSEIVHLASCKVCLNSGFATSEALAEHLEICQKSIKGLKLSRVDEIFPSLIPIVQEEESETPEVKSSRSNDLACSYCPQSFTDRKTYRTHVFFHFFEELSKDVLDPENPNTCSQCEEQFSDTKKVLKHVAFRHQMLRKYMDPVLADQFFQTSTLADTTCKECKKVFISKKLLDRHVAFRHVKLTQSKLERTCEYCGKICLTKKIRDSHVFYRHIRPQNLKSDRTCPYCNKILQSKKKLDIHISYRHVQVPTNLASRTCDQCDKVCKTKDLLDRHIRAVHGEMNESEEVMNKFICIICQKICLSQRSLERHEELAHSESKPKPSTSEFACRFCGVVMENKDQFHSHVLNCDLNSIPLSDRTCSVCQKIFINKTGLSNHFEYVHKKPGFSCPICNKGFKKEYALKEHTKIKHPQKKEYFCYLCPFPNKNFNSKCSLNTHLAGKHYKDILYSEVEKENPKLESCHICYKTFGDGNMTVQKKNVVVLHYATIHNALLKYLKGDILADYKKGLEGKLSRQKMTLNCPVCKDDLDITSIGPHLRSHLTDALIDSTNHDLENSSNRLCQVCQKSMPLESLVNHCINTHPEIHKSIIPDQFLEFVSFPDKNGN